MEAAEELAGRIGQTAEACEALGVARSTLYRRRQSATSKPKRRPRPHRALDETEREVAWDLAGDAFGTRQLQYERYYVGDPVRILARTFLAYDRTECQKLVDYALALAGDPEGST